MLDYGRFVAALAVMAFHYGLNGISNGKIHGVEANLYLAEFFKYGYLGVEFFFVISGYVICRSTSGKTPGEFLVSRFVRLYPAFWAGVAVTATFAFFLGGDKMSVSLYQVLANLTMFPGYVGVPYVDGVYWTLELELAFYCLIFFIIVFGSPKAVDHFTLVWPIILILAFLANKWYWPYLGGYYYFFSAGCLFALIERTGYRLPNIVSLVVITYLCISFSAGKAETLSTSKGLVYSATTIGLLVAVMFIFFAMLNFSKIASLRLPGSKYMGSVTYPLYLIHAHVGYMLISALNSYISTLWAYVIAVFTVFVLASLINMWVEVKFARQWKSLFLCLVGRPVDVFIHSSKEKIIKYGKFGQ